MKGNLRYSSLFRTLLFLIFAITKVYAGAPLWTFTPLTSTTIVIPSNSLATVQYRVTNQSSRAHTLTMEPITGVTQETSGARVCGNPIRLNGKDSCTLSLRINGSMITSPVVNGPTLCQKGSRLQCYRPAQANVLRITQAAPSNQALIEVIGSPLSLTIGSTGQLSIRNNTLDLAATNITSDFTGTALDGNLAETGNTCANLLPTATCTLTYTPGNAEVAQTNFPIEGTNTNTVTAAISIQSGSALTAINPNSGTTSGGTGFTLTGTGLTGATGVTFDGDAATSVNVVNSTTVTGVTPSHAAGVVDVVISTPAGGATLTSGYTYIATAIGQSSGGGVIACTEGGLDNFILFPQAEVSAQWGGLGVLIGVGAQSTTDGASNTAAIVAVQGAGTTYAPQICSALEVDSQGNTPCEAGNACYNDWFLPARDQLLCLYSNRAALGNFSVLDYWSSTESGANDSVFVMFSDGSTGTTGKNQGLRFRCVRAFIPSP